MIRVGIYSGRNQAGYISNQLLGFLDDPSWGFSFGPVARGSHEILEIYLQNDSTESESIKDPYLICYDEEENPSIYGEISLSTTPTLPGGSPVDFKPSRTRVDLSTTHLRPNHREYFFFRVVVNSRANLGASRGPTLQLVSLLEDF